MARGSGRWFLSIRVRAAVLAGLAALLVFGLAGFAERADVYREQMNTSISEASHRASVLGAALRASGASIVLGEDGLISHDIDQYLGEADRASLTQWTWAVTDLRDGRLLESHGSIQVFLRHGLKLPQSISGAPGQTGTTPVTLSYPRTERCVVPGCELRDRTVQLATAAVKSGATLSVPLGIFVLASPSAADAAVAVIDRLLVLGLPVTVLAVASIAWMVASRTLRSAEAIREQLVHITANDLSRRVPVPRSGDEIARLAITTNETLDRLEGAITRQRRFVADAAHELRSPLAGLLNNLEVSLAHPDRADWPQVVQTALGQARRLRELTDDLLLLARLDRAVTPPDRVVDLDAVVAEQVAERRFAHAEGPRFTLAATSGSAQVAGDESQLGRLLRNLLDNAATHARTSVQVSITDTSADQVDVEVFDDGPGIPPDDRDRVFERFTRLDSARDRDRGGAGLGLAIARDIATQHGGSIAIADSDLGTRVIVRLPTAANDRTDPPSSHGETGRPVATV